jgi:hypothetical protein
MEETSPSGAGDDSIEDSCDDNGVDDGEGYEEISLKGRENSGGGEGEVENSVKGDDIVLDACDATRVGGKPASLVLVAVEEGANNKREGANSVGEGAKGVMGENGGRKDSKSSHLSPSPSSHSTDLNILRFGVFISLSALFARLKEDKVERFGT